MSRSNASGKSRFMQETYGRRNRGGGIIRDKKVDTRSQSQSREKSYETQITEAYRDVLQRDPDKGGLAHYIDQARGGRSVDEIRSEMAGSDEYKSRFGSSGGGGGGGPVTEPVPGVSQDTYNALLNQYNSLSGRIGDVQRDADDRVRRAQDDFDRRFGTFRTEMEGKLSGLQGQYDIVQGRYDAEVEARRADKERFDTTLAEKEADFLDQLNAQARAEADAQLRDLRAGSTATATAGPRGVVGLASGQTTASRREKGPMMDVRPEVNATDSVLDRSGPVVQLISRLRDRRPSGGGRSPLSGGGGGNYYASRFG